MMFRPKALDPETIPLPHNDCQRDYYNTAVELQKSNLLTPENLKNLDMKAQTPGSADYFNKLWATLYVLNSIKDGKKPRPITQDQLNSLFSLKSEQINMIRSGIVWAKRETTPEMIKNIFEYCANNQIDLSVLADIGHPHPTRASLKL